MSNASLLASVKRAIDEPQVRSGTDALHLPGPDGTWRLAQYARSKHNRTYWTIKVTSPHGATFHSFSSLSQHLDQLGGDDESDPMEEDEEVDAADGDAADDDAADDALRLRAAVHLQEVVRVRRFRAACREVARLRAAVLSVRAAAAVATGARARSLRPERLVVPELAGPVAGATLLDSRTEIFDLDREYLARLAQDVQDPGALEYPYARAIRATPHFPLVVGRLPLCAEGLHATAVGGRRLYVRGTPGLSARHEALLNAEFALKWTRHLQMVAGVRRVGFYDVFEDACERSHVGSIVVERLLVRERARLYPALSIESIVAASRERRGQGTLLVEVARRLLFFRAPPAATAGYLFAQCIDSGFWAGEEGGLLDRSAVAMTLVFQMQTLSASYHFEEECSARARLVHVDDEGASPRKQPM